MRQMCLQESWPLAPPPPLSPREPTLQAPPPQLAVYARQRAASTRCGSWMGCVRWRKFVTGWQSSQQVQWRERFSSHDRCGCVSCEVGGAETRGRSSLEDDENTTTTHHGGSQSLRLSARVWRGQAQAGCVRTGRCSLGGPHPAKEVPMIASDDEGWRQDLRPLVARGRVRERERERGRRPCIGHARLGHTQRRSATEVGISSTLVW